MKIERFNEVFTYHEEKWRRSKNLPKKVFDFIESLDGSVDYNIQTWISYIAKATNHKEYKNLLMSPFLDETINFLEEKQLKIYKEFIDCEYKEERLQRELEEIQKKRIALYPEAASEIVYKFQEDLIENDFDSFYKFFIEEENPQDLKNNNDIHPVILKKYYDEIKIKIEALKYNL